MTYSHSLPEKADIYIKSRQSFFPVKHYKPLVILKLCFIVVLGSLTLFTGAIILTPPETSSAISAAETANKNDNDHRNAPTPSPFIIRFRPTIRTSAILINSNMIRFRPAQTSAMQTSTSTFVPPGHTFIPPGQQNRFTSFPMITPFPVQANFADTTTNTTQSSGDVGGISSQIIAIQQQIGNQMQSCVSNAQQMANQIIQLQNEQKQLQAEIDSLNNQASNIDTSTTAGQRQSDAINNQIQQLQTESDSLGNNISTAQDDFGNANSQCQDSVSNLESQRGQLESNLDDAFNSALDIQFPQ